MEDKETKVVSDVNTEYFRNVFSVSTYIPCGSELYNYSSCTVQGMATTGRQLFDLYCRGENLPSNNIPPKYEDKFRTHDVPYNNAHAKVMAGEKLSEFRQIVLSLPDKSSTSDSPDKVNIPSSDHNGD